MFSDDLVIKIIDLNAPAKTEHMFWSKRHVPSGNFASVGANMLDLESVLDNGNNVNHRYHAKAEDQQ